MNRVTGAVLGTGALLVIAGLVLRNREDDSEYGFMDTIGRANEDRIERIDSTELPIADTLDKHDTLSAMHDLGPNAAETLRAEARLDEDAALSPEREEMFEKAGESGEAGSMVRPELYDDRNRIGRQG